MRLSAEQTRLRAISAASCMCQFVLQPWAAGPRARGKRAAVARSTLIACHGVPGCLRGADRAIWPVSFAPLDAIGAFSAY